jgi:dihydroxyacetone kinase-like protein
MVSEEIKREAVRTVVENIAARIQAERDYLIDLDSAIGDADHGANLDRGFQAAVEEVADADEASPQDIAKTVGMSLITEVGGASGPLYGGSCMHASSELADGIDRETSVAFAEAYLEKVIERGGAEVGDKTMVDALTPFVHTYKKSVEEDDVPPVEALDRAVDACRRGVEFTVGIKANKGRASYLGWRSVGHQDPGATSTMLILEVILRTAREYIDAGEIDTDATSPTVPDPESEEELP